MPNFEVFHPVQAPRPGSPTVTVTSMAAISFSREAYGLLGEPEAVKLLYDKGNQIIGFQPARRGDENAYTCRLNGKSTRTVSASAFCKWAGLADGTARRWPMTVEDGIGCVDINLPGVRVTSNRRKD
jgi:hypothetical protein